MNCTIRKILVFGNDNSSREVDLYSGLNIITGHSKKGKSALIEIVDYCLCSSLSTIPKGIISDYAAFYGLVLKFDNSYLIIGRPSWENSESNKVYVEYEDSIFDVDNISIEYFKNKVPHKIKGAGQDLIEKHLGLNVSNIRLPESDKKPQKASLRNMTPFLFQYQNLIASKHALFSKLEDHYRRKDIIDQLPIFLGIVNDEYYSLKRQIDELEQKLKKIELEKEKDKKFQDEYTRKLEGLYRNYFSVVGIPFAGPLSTQDLISLRKNLPEMNESEYLKTDSIRRYKNLKETQADLSFRLDQINSEISDITQSQIYAKKITASLNLERDKNEDAIIHDSTCPICGSYAEDLNQDAIKVRHALSSLNSEIKSMVSFARYDSEQIEILKKNRRELQNQIRENETELKVLQDYRDRLQQYKNKQESIVYLKAQIEVLAEQIARKATIHNYGDVEIREEIRDLKEAISIYNFDKDIYNSEINLSDWMSSICNKLDFEDDFRPAKLSMKLNELAVYHNDQRYGKVSLSDMGSGANWLAVHISVSLGMLRLFAQSQKSVVPSFLFLDQPSQVYFPDNFSNQSLDKKNVENIYKLIIEELETIKKLTGNEPQVIVLDHASELDLGKYNFIDYLREDWHGDDALI